MPIEESGGQEPPPLQVPAKIPAAARAATLRQADLELLTRITAATIFYPLLLLLLGVTTPYRADYPTLYRYAVVAIALAVVVRALLFAFRQQLYSLGRRCVVVPLFLSMTLSAGAAGLLYIHIILSYGITNWTFTFMLMWLLGISAGSTISFTPSFSFLSMQIALLFGPALGYEFLPRSPHGLSLGIAMLAFIGFLLTQGSRVHGMYWDLLADRAIEKQRALELEAARAASERAQVQLRYQATHDVLTGVMNRAEILRVCASEIDRAIRLGTSLGLVMIDLDHFKQVNDRFGHLGGDDVLRCVAARVAGQLRPYDSLGRYGGEEFLIILPACDVHQCAAAAERIRAAIERDPIPLPHAPAKVTASFGVTVLDPPPCPDQRQMIARADTALYEAKKNGRNRVAIQIPRSGPTHLLSA